MPNRYTSTNNSVDRRSGPEVRIEGCMMLPETLCSGVEFVGCGFGKLATRDCFFIRSTMEVSDRLPGIMHDRERVVHDGNYYPKKIDLHLGFAMVSHPRIDKDPRN